MFCVPVSMHNYAIYEGTGLSKITLPDFLSHFPFIQLQVSEHSSPK